MSLTNFAYLNCNIKLKMVTLRGLPYLQIHSLCQSKFSTECDQMLPFKFQYILF
jgi:hypothetical protein